MSRGWLLGLAAAGFYAKLQEQRFPRGHVGAVGDSVVGRGFLVGDEDGESKC